jgi:lipooligosaccharide transport system permease protein
MSSGVLAVFEYYLVGYRRTWRARLMSSFVLPMLTLLGIGVGVGSYLSRGFDGVPYSHWIVPGLVASTAVNVAVGDSTWPVYTNHGWTGTYATQSGTPLHVGDILGGHLGFVLFRVSTSCVMLLLVATMFGAVSSPWSLVALPVAVLLGLAVAGPVFAYASTVPSDMYFAFLLRFWVIPMSLFAGVFFPVDSLPVAVRPLAYASPLWSGVSLIRAAMQGGAPDWPAPVHLLYLGTWAGVGWVLAYARFRRRLIR